MFPLMRAFTEDSKAKPPPRFAPKPRDSSTCLAKERPHTADSAGMKIRHQSSTLEDMRVIWRQSQVTEVKRHGAFNLDGQMPVEQLSDTSDSSENSSTNVIDPRQRSMKRQKKEASSQKIKVQKDVVTKVAAAPVTAKVSVVCEKVKEFADVGVQAMRPVTIDAMVDGRMINLESRLRLEEMRSRSWGVRMTEAEDTVKKLQAQVQSLTDRVNANAMAALPPIIVNQESLAPERRRTLKLGGGQTSQHKDFTSEFNAMLMQIRKENEAEDYMGDYCGDTKP